MTKQPDVETAAKSRAGIAPRPPIRFVDVGRTHTTTLRNIIRTTNNAGHAVIDVLRETIGHNQHCISEGQGTFFMDVVTFGELSDEAGALGISLDPLPGHENISDGLARHSFEGVPIVVEK